MCYDFQKHITSNDFGKLVIFMELRQLEYFITSAEEHSFYKASQVLFTSQPAVSKGIANLEKEVNAKLFERTNRGLRLTKRGETLYHYAKNVLRQVALMKDSEGGHKQVMSLTSYPSHRIATILTDFYLRYEELHLDYREGTVQDIVELVHSGISEFGIVYIAPTQEGAFEHILSHKYLEFVPIHEAELCIYVGENHPLYGSKQPIDLQTLGELRYLRGARDFFSVEHHFDYVNLSELNTAQFDDRVLTNSDHLVSTMLGKTDLAYLGIHTKAVHDESKLRIDAPETRLTLGYLKTKGTTLSPIAMDFIQYLNVAITASYSCD